MEKHRKEWNKYGEAMKKVTKGRSLQRVHPRHRWEPEGLEAIDTSCQQLYEKRLARGVQIEGSAGDPRAV